MISNVRGIPGSAESADPEKASEGRSLTRPQTQWARNSSPPSQQAPREGDRTQDAQLNFKNCIYFIKQWTLFSITMSHAIVHPCI